MEENNAIGNNEETKKENWADFVEIVMPLSEYNKLMKKIKRNLKNRSN